MSGLIDERLGRPLDLTWVAQEVCTQALVPTVVDGLPPGAAAACLLYELTRRPDWVSQMTAELEAIPAGQLPQQLAGVPSQAAPVTYRFVKETLRMWSPPLFMTRPVRTDIQSEHACLHAGQRYLLSTYLIHHDPRNWKDPDTFDPNRWLPEAGHGPGAGNCYVPFGWPPKACLGAGLGTIQLMLLCHLMCTRLSFLFAIAGSVGFILGWSLYLQGTHPQTEAEPAWVVREALRLWPVAWMLGRRPSRPHEVAGHAVTPQDEVIVCPYAVHRNPRHWDDPYSFRPERWAAAPDP